MLVLTKSIVSTPSHLDIKVRVAQGLSREGWPITKNILYGIFLLTLGFFTFVPIIQEFCLFGIVALLSDLFLQLSFFTTILSVDIQRIELNAIKKAAIKPIQKRPELVKGINQGDNSRTPLNVFARPSPPTPHRVPRRLRLVFFWARTRMVHRFLMLCLVLWIANLVLKSGLVDPLSSPSSPVPSSPQYSVQSSKVSDSRKFKSSLPAANIQTSEVVGDKDQEPGAYNRLRHFNPTLWASLTGQHWSTLLGYYNISLSGRYISILPSIHLSIPVDPESAMQTRHPSESNPQIFRQFLSPKLDPEDDLEDFGGTAGGPEGHLFRPQTRTWTTTELILGLALALPTIVLVIYFFVTLYRCMCSRNYAEWREKWKNLLTASTGNRIGEEVVTENMPVKLVGHRQEIDYIAASEETPFVASVSMEGDIRIWDVLSGECHTFLRRTGVIPPLRRSTSSTAAGIVSNTVSNKAGFKPRHKPSGSFSSDSTYGSSPGTTSAFLFDEPTITTTSSSSSFKTHRRSHSWSNRIVGNSTPGSGFNFGPYYNQLNSSQTVIKDMILNAAADSEIETVENKANLCTGSPLTPSPVWSLAIFDRFLYLGTASGRVEVWDAIAGSLLATEMREEGDGVTVLRINDSKVISGHLSGYMDIYNVQLGNGIKNHHHHHHPPPHHHHHSASSPPYMAKFGSKGGGGDGNGNDLGIGASNPFRWRLCSSIRAHRQPVTALQIESSHIVTGSADHLLKVYKLDTGQCVYTLHGHCGGITTVQIDKSTPPSALSGCQVGQVCVWDLITGTCIFSLEAHQGARVSSLLATLLYVISAGTDNKICIWDKYSGHLVHTIYQHHSICKEMLLLARNILVTAREDHLVLWDVSEAAPLRAIILDPSEKHSYIKNIQIASKSRAVVCDYGKYLCVVHFPGITQKYD